MTIACVSLLGERALVGADSEATIGNERVNVGKLFPIPHLNAVLVGRGSYLLLVAVASACFTATGGLRSVLGGMPKQLEDQQRMLRATLQRNGLERAADSAGVPEIALVGWSPEDQRMIGQVFTAKDGAFMAREIKNPGAWIAPYDASFDQVPNPKTIEQMVDLARKQAQVMVQKAPLGAAGGKLIIAELQRERMTIAPAYDFGRLARAA